MLTILLILVPIVSGLLSLFMQRNTVKTFACISSIISFAIAIIAYTQFDKSSGTQFVMDVSWINILGIHFHIGMDGISLLMILLSNLLTPFIIVSTFKDSYKNPSVFYALILIMQGAMNGVFVSLDVFLYYIFWELALIPGYFLVLWWGAGDSRKITFKFFIYTLFGSLFMLVAIIYLSSIQNSSDVSAIYSLSLLPSTQVYIFFAFMIAFAIKIPIFPFHTWQPDTYTNAPAPATMLLSGIMLKMGLYSIIRWIIPIVPNALESYRNGIIILAAIGVLYASLIAWTQKDIKRLFAYSSIAHVGLITAGILTVTATGLQGGLVQMLAHGINVVALFYICQILYRHSKSHAIDTFGGIRNKAPLFAGLYLIVMLGSVALPLTNGFPGEFMLLSAVFNYNAWLTLLAGSGIILGAVYMFVSYKNIMLGETNALTKTFSEIDMLDKVVLIPLVILIFIFGVYPSFVTDLTSHSVDILIQQFQSHTINLNSN